MPGLNIACKIPSLIALMIFSFSPAAAQTTEFTYQGKLSDNETQPSATYDFEFRLFDVETRGSALGTQTKIGQQT